MDLLEAMLLGLIQGITEWLPISSSAHLAFAQRFFGIEASVAFDIILHLGTLSAVVAYYRSDIYSLVRGLIAFDGKSISLAGLILLCAVPTAIIGFTLKDFFESMFASPLAISFALLVTGLLLLVSSKIRAGSHAIGVKESLMIGVAQGIAVAPGISRSGSTICTALLLGIGKEEAARFSFLAAILPVLGAGILEGRHALDGAFEPVPLAAGFITAAVVGYLSIGLLIRFLNEGRFQIFGYYCIALAIFASVATIIYR